MSGPTLKSLARVGNASAVTRLKPKSIAVPGQGGWRRVMDWPLANSSNLSFIILPLVVVSIGFALFSNRWRLNKRQRRTREATSQATAACAGMQLNIQQPKLPTGRIHATADAR